MLCFEEVIREPRVSCSECGGFSSMPCVEESAGIEPESDDKEAGNAEGSEDEGGPERNDASAMRRSRLFGTGRTGKWTVRGLNKSF